MKFCTKCGKELLDAAVVCPGCGCPVEGAQQAAAPTIEINSTNMNQVNAGGVPDEVSVGLCILSFLIPIFGIIYWVLKYKETPKKAKACGTAAMVAWILGMMFSTFATLGSSFLFASI